MPRSYFQTPMYKYGPMQKAGGAGVQDIVTLLHDDFTGSLDTDIDGRTPDTVAPADTWHAATGAVEIFGVDGSGYGGKSNVSPNEGGAYIDIGKAPSLSKPLIHTMTYNNNSVDSRYMYYYFRWDNTAGTGFGIAIIYDVATTTLSTSLIKYSPGATTVDGVDSTVNAGLANADINITITDNGSDILVEFDNAVAAIADLSVTDATYASSTQIRAGTKNNSNKIDFIKVVQ